MFRTPSLSVVCFAVSTLAATLDKPLTCRLFPVPSKAAGERTAFDSPYIANAGVLRGGDGGSPTLLRRAAGGAP